METTRNICRLCFTLINDDNFVLLGEPIKKVFLELHMNLDFDLTVKPLACGGCAEKLQKAEIFRISCLNTEKLLLPFFAANDTAKVNLNDVYVKVHEGVTEIEEQQLICRLCIKLMNSGIAISLKELKNRTDFENILLVHLPEVNLNATTELTICKSCYESLESFVTFVTSCLKVEMNLKKYLKSKGQNERYKIDLDILLNVSSENSALIEEVKKEIELDEQAANDEIMDTPDFIPENITINELIKEEMAESENEYLDSESKHDVELALHENSLPSSTFTNSIVPQNLPPNTKIYQCQICTYESKYSGNLAKHIKAKHADPSNQTVYKCPDCVFETNMGEYLHKHMLIHKSGSDRKVHKCETCQYETIHKKNLAAHSLIHKDPSELLLHRCPCCPYASKFKACLRKHILVTHENSDVEILKCTLCPYETKLKEYLSKHMAKHEDRKNVKIFQCQECSYKAKFQYEVNRHMITHKNIIELELLKCEFCSFETRYKKNFTKHLVTFHKDPKVATTYKCEMCTFQAKHKHSFDFHMARVHKTNISDGDECDTKEDFSLGVHTNLLKTTKDLFKCAECGFETKNQASLKKHLQCHILSSNVIAHRCDSCAFVTRNKRHLLKHMRTHKKIQDDEVEVKTELE